MLISLEFPRLAVAEAGNLSMCEIDGRAFAWGTTRIYTRFGAGLAEFTLNLLNPKPRAPYVRFRVLGLGFRAWGLIIIGDYIGTTTGIHSLIPS